MFTARVCTDDPPAPWMGIDMDWPLKKRILGTTISYTCPWRMKTNLEELSGNFVFINRTPQQYTVGIKILDTKNLDSSEYQTVKSLDFKWSS